MKIGFALRFVMAQKETIINMEKTVGLLAAAGVLMLLAGVLLGFLRQWVCAGLLCVGAFGCLIAALSFKKRKNEAS